MSRTLIPRSAGDLNNFGINFTQQLETAPGGPADFGLSDADASAFVDAQNAYAAAYARNENMETRGPSSVQGLRDQRANFVEVIRTTVTKVELFPGLTDQMRVDLQIPVPEPRGVVPPPAAELAIQVESVDGTAFSVRLSDPEHPTRRRKPDHATTATLLYHVGETAPTTIEGWTLSGTVSKTRTVVQVNPQTAPGSKVWFIGYWSNGKGESGNPGQPVAAFTQFTEGGLTELRIAA
ncbi:MAG: hypothetical protein AAF916_03275 [Planctomycetota bacterium]